MTPAQWLRNVVRSVFALDRPNTITTSEDLDTWMRHGGRDTAAGVPIGIRNASGLAAVAACERVLCSDVAQLPLVLYRSTADTREPATDHPLFTVLKARPNPNQTSFQFRKVMHRDLFYRGNAYARIVRDTRGNVVELIRLHPDLVTPRIERRTQAVTYDYRTPDGTTIASFAKRDIFHLWEVSEDGVMGITALEAYRESIGDGIAMRQHGSHFFSRAARIAGVLEMPTGVRTGGKNVNDFLKDFEDMYAGNDNGRKTAALPAGVKFQTISLSMADAQWLEARKLNAREVFGIWGVPPHKGGDLERATFSNVESENISYVVNGLMPRLVCWEQAINRDLLDNDPSLYVKFNVSGLLRGDFKSRQEGLQIQRRNGIINANEWRALEELNPRADDGGEVYIVETNMQKNDGQEGDEPAGATPPAQQEGQR